MAKLTLQQLQEKISKLPPDIQRSYSASETGEILQKIGQENKLTTMKTSTMTDETGLFMLGVTHPNNFIKNLATRMEIDNEVAKKIAHEINEKIFKKIRGSLRKIHSQEEETLKTETPTPPVSSIITPQQTFTVKNQEEKSEPVLEIPKSSPTAESKPISPLPTKPTPTQTLPKKFDINNKQKRDNKIFEKRTKEVHRAPVSEPKYKGSDPYREPTN